MIVLTEEERKKFKEILRTVMSLEDLKSQFDKASAAKKIEPGDHQSAVLGLYTSLIEEIHPGIADLKKSRLPAGPKTFQPKQR